MTFKMPVVAISFMFYIFLTEKCLANNAWLAYIDSSIYTRLKTLTIRDNVQKTLSFYLHKRSLDLRQMINVNFVNTTHIKRTVGSIICCPFFERVIRIHKVWWFHGTPILHFNVTFTYFNVGTYLKYSNLEEYVKFVKASPKSLPDWLFSSSYDKDRPGTHFTGRRNKIEFFTGTNRVYFDVFTFPTSEIKLNIIFSVMNDLVQGQRFPNDLHENRENLYLRLESYFVAYKQPKSCYQAFNIVMKKIYVIGLRFSRNNNYSRILLLRVYDGPDYSATSIPLKGYYVGLSSFQCFLALKVLHGFWDTCFNFNKFAAKIETFEKTYIHIHMSEANAPKQITLNQCDHSNVIYCIFNVTIETNYINASLQTLNFTGPNIHNCLFGGIAYYQGMYRSEGNGSFRYEMIEIKTYCDTFTATPKEGSMDKLPIDFVSSESEMLIVIYGYHPYNTGMDVDIMVSVVPCKGVIPCQKGREKIFLISKRIEI